MAIVSKSSFDFGNLNEFYYKLLKEEDFNFKTKDIKIDINLEKVIDCKIFVNSILDLKIAINALIKSLEIIEKSINV